MCSSDLSDLFQELGSGIVGLVSGYGICHKHTKGFRSQFMHVLAIAPTDIDTSSAIFFNGSSNSFQLNSSMNYNQAIDIVGSNLNVPVISMKELIALGDKYEVS